jgi:hypothetical protein
VAPQNWLLVQGSVGMPPHMITLQAPPLELLLELELEAELLPLELDAELLPELELELEAPPAPELLLELEVAPPPAPELLLELPGAGTHSRTDASRRDDCSPVHTDPAGQPEVATQTLNWQTEPCGHVAPPLVQLTAQTPNVPQVCPLGHSPSAWQMRPPG